MSTPTNEAASKCTCFAYCKKGLGAIPLASILWATLAWVAFGVYQEALLEIDDHSDIWPGFVYPIFRAYSITIHVCLIACLLLAIASTGWIGEQLVRASLNLEATRENCCSRCLVKTGWCFGAAMHWIFGGIMVFLWMIFSIVMLIIVTTLVVAFTIL